MLDLSIPTNRDILADRIRNDIDEYCAKTYNEGHRNHLGASLMGETCSRKLWYNFRWVKQEQHSGRIQRLFQVGHNAEPRFIEYLRGIGFEVWERDPVTGKQFRISACNGHYGGSLDAKCKAPARYELTQNLIFLGEFKTNGTGVGFSKVATSGVEKEKPKHYAQMSQYGLHEKLEYGLYIIENKNDSDLIVKIVKLDWNLGRQLELKAGDIINSKIPPQRVAENPDFFDCKYCHFKGICFDNEPVEKNCRSCKYAKPIENANWECTMYHGIIPKDFIIKGCPEHVSINT